MKLRHIVRFGLGTATLALTSARGFSEITYPVSGSPAVVYWYLDWEAEWNDPTGSGSDCTDAEKQSVIDAITFYPSRPVHLLKERPPTIPSGEPVITLETLQDDFQGCGLAQIDTHGSSLYPGGALLEWHWDSDDAQRRVAYYDSLYDASSGTRGFQSEHLHVGPWETPSGPLWEGIITMKPAGIAVYFKGKNDPHGLIYASYSLSDYARTFWAHSDGEGTYLGYTPGATGEHTCTDVEKIYNRLGCDDYPAISGWLPGALWGEVWPGDEVSSYLLAYGGTSTFYCTEDNYSNITGCEWMFSGDKSCFNNAATFARVGAFPGTIWGIIAHTDSDSLVIVGLNAATAFPPSGQVVRELQLLPDGQHAYIESGVSTGSFPYFAFVETDIHGHRNWSDPFPVTTQPEDWQDILNYNNTVHEPVPPPPGGGPGVSQEIWLGQNGEILYQNPYNGIATVNPYPAAHVGLYGRDANVVLEEAYTILDLGYVGTHPEYSPIRLFVGDGSVEDQRAWAESLRTANLNYRAWCQSHGTCDPNAYPPDPVFGLVGSVSNVAAGAIRYGVFPSQYGQCRDATCIDYNAGANLDQAGLEDLPVYLVPTSDLLKIGNLRGSAIRYNRNDPLQRAVFLIGDYIPMNDGGVQQDDEEALANLQLFYEATMPVSEMRDSQTSFSQIRSAINAGCSDIVGIGGGTNGFKWPAFGGVLCYDCPWSDLGFDTPQSVVALLPACGSGLASYNAITWKGVFADTSLTTLAFAMGKAQGGYGLHHQLWAEELGLAVADAAVDISWPRIVWDAKNRALLHYPFLEGYLRNTVSMGTMVRKRPAVPSTSVGDEGAIDDNLLFALRALESALPHPTIEYTLPASDHVTLAIYDARGRLVSKLQSTFKERGRHRFTWSGRDQRGTRVAGGVYFARLFTQNHGTAVTKMVLTR